MDLIQAAQKLHTHALDASHEMGHTDRVAYLQELEPLAQVIHRHKWRVYDSNMPLVDETYYSVMTKHLKDPQIVLFTMAAGFQTCHAKRRTIGFDQVTHFAPAVVPQRPVPDREAALLRLRGAVAGDAVLLADINTLLGGAL